MRAAHGRAVFVANGAGGGIRAVATDAPTQGSAPIPVSSSPFTIQVGALNPSGVSVAHGLGKVPDTSVTSSELFPAPRNSVGTKGPNLENPVVSWRSVSIPATGDFSVVVAQRCRQAEITVAGASEHGSLRANAVLDSGADIPSTPKPFYMLLEHKFHGVQIRSILV